MKKSALPVKITGKRILLRSHQPSFAPALFAGVDKDRVRLGRFLPWVAGTKTVRDSRAFIKKSLADWKARTTFNYSIFHKESGAFVGTISVFRIDWESACCEIGYWLAGEFEGQGLMSDAVRTLQAACFAKGLHRIEIRCDPRNKKSAAIPQRLGYRLEGRLRQNQTIKGRRGDTLIFGKLRS